MRRPQELVDRQQFLQPVSAVLQGARVAREAAGIARGVDHARHLRPRQFRRSAPRRRRAADRAGRRRRRRAPSPSADCGRDRAARPSPCRRPAGAPPPRPRQPPACRSRTRPACRPGRATARRRRQTDRPASAHRRSIRSTAARIACSARLVACRKAPGGGSIRGLAEDQQRRAADDDRLGAMARSPQLSRARSARSASATSACRRSSDRSSRLCGRISRSTPLSVSLATASAAAPSGRITASAARNGSSRRVERRPRDDAGADIDDPRAGPLVEAGQHAPALAAQHEVGTPPLARRADAEAARSAARRRRAASARARSARPSRRCRRRAASAAGRSRRRP